MILTLGSSIRAASQSVETSGSSVECHFRSDPSVDLGPMASVVLRGLRGACQRPAKPDRGYGTSG